MKWAWILAVGKKVKMECFPCTEISQRLQDGFWKFPVLTSSSLGSYSCLRVSSIHMALYEYFSSFLCLFLFLTSFHRFYSEYLIYRFSPNREDFLILVYLLKYCILSVCLDYLLSKILMSRTDCFWQALVS